MFSTLLMKQHSSAPCVDARALEHPADCGGEPCDAVARGFRAFFDRKLDGLAANGRACADCHMPTDSFQLSPASVEARFQLLQRRRRWNPDADDPLFRPIDADDFRTNGDNASDFSNLRQNGLVRITFTLPPNIRLIDPATNLPSAETEVDVWRSVPTVNDVALTGPDNGILWPRGPNETGGYQLDGRFSTLQEQALAALTNHAQIRHAPPQRLLDDLSSFQRVLFTNESCSRLVGRRASGHRAVAGSRSQAQCARATGKGGVRTRLRPVPRRPRTIDPAGDAQRSACAGDSVPQHLQPVSTPRRSGRALRVRGVSATTRAQCAHLRRSRCRSRHRALRGPPFSPGTSFAARRPIPAARS